MFKINVIIAMGLSLWGSQANCSAPQEEIKISLVPFFGPCQQTTKLTFLPCARLNKDHITYSLMKGPYAEGYFLLPRFSVAELPSYEKDVVFPREIQDKLKIAINTYVTKNMPELDENIRKFMAENK